MHLHTNICQKTVLRQTESLVKDVVSHDWKCLNEEQKKLLLSVDFYHIFDYLILAMFLSKNRTVLAHSHHSKNTSTWYYYLKLKISHNTQLLMVISDNFSFKINKFAYINLPRQRLPLTICCNNECWLNEQSNLAAVL